MLLLTGAEIESPQISNEVASLAEQVADERRVRRVVELARDRHPGARETGNQVGRQLMAFGGFHGANVRLNCWGADQGLLERQPPSR